MGVLLAAGVRAGAARTLPRPNPTPWRKAVPTQDLDDDEAVSAYIAAGVLLAAKLACEQAPRAHVVLLAVTPRGDRGVDWPARHMYSQPCKCAA